MTREEMRYKLNELRMMLNDGEHGEEQGILVDIIKELDKAENKGEWIIDDTETVHGHCNKCGWESHYYEDDVVGMNFCPNCGCSMKGGE